MIKEHFWTSIYSYYLILCAQGGTDQMHAWEQIQITIDYIENNLNEEICIAALAEKAGLSQFYYQRLFHRLVKKTVAEYYETHTPETKKMEIWMKLKEVVNYVR